MFASYKGEGTGAVGHMFSHHVLKPERIPIEANVWGTPASSGSFSTLYRSRVLRAIDYREAPFEIAVSEGNSRQRTSKLFHLSTPMGTKVYGKYPKGGLPQGALYISCGDSSKTDLPTGCVDLVVTDPPFFDNVHYSELADFFHVWQRLVFDGKRPSREDSTRSTAEVQDTDVTSFANKLQAVFAECCRVLRDEGRLVFSYHHSRDDGWAAIASALTGAGFSPIQAQPVKSEMSVAAPKSQAKEPIDLDVLLVCVKSAADSRPHRSLSVVLEQAASTTLERVLQFGEYGRRLSRNDVQVVLLSQLLVELAAGRSGSSLAAGFSNLLMQAKPIVEELWRQQTVPPSLRGRRKDKPAQLSLFAAHTATGRG